MSSHFLRLILLFCLLSSIGSAALVRGPGPFMQRVAPNDFLRLEKINDLEFSKNGELVIYTTDSGRIMDALTMRSNGTEYVLTYTRYGDQEHQGVPEKKAYSMPTPIAKRVIEAVALMMQYDVLAPAGVQEDPEPNLGYNRWLLLRMTPTQAIAGMVEGNRFHSHRDERSLTFYLLLSKLEQLTRDEYSDDLNQVLMDIDRMSDNFVASEKAARFRQHNG